MEALSRQECESILNRNEIGRLGCFSTAAQQVYVVPISYRFRNGAAYFASLPGQKLDYLSQHPDGVCLEVEEVDRDDNWNTVIVTGRFAETSGGEQVVEGFAALKRVARGPLRDLFAADTSPLSGRQLKFCVLRPTTIAGRRDRWAPEPAHETENRRRRAAFHERRTSA